MTVCSVPSFSVVGKNSRPFILANKIRQKAKKLLSNFSDAKNVCVVFAGGLGRGEMFPFSDVDLMFFEREKGEASLIIEKTVRLFYDTGIDIGFSVRTPEEAVRLALKDLKVLTMLLDASFAEGDESLFKDMSLHIQAYSVRLSKYALKSFILRRKKRSPVDINLEPDLKNDRGGFRDFQEAVWAVRLISLLPDMENRVKDLRRLLSKCKRSAEFISEVRFSAESLAKKKCDVLTPEIFFGVAKARGTDQRRFYRSLARHMDKIAVITDAVVEKAADAAGVLQNSGCGKKYRRTFVSEAVNRLEGGDFKWSADFKMSVWSEVESGRMISSNMEKRLFNIFIKSKNKERLLLLMYETRLLDVMFPVFKKIRFLHPMDFSHKFPVDVHSLRCALSLCGCKRNCEPEICMSALNGFKNFALAVMAALLHDVGKAFGKNHSVKGVAACSSDPGVLRLDADRRELLLFLIREHLLFGRAVFRIDPNDPVQLYRLAVSVGTVRKLDGLLALGCADKEALDGRGWSRWHSAVVINVYKNLRNMLLEEGKGKNVKKMLQNHIRALVSKLNVRTERRKEKLLSFVRRWPRSYLLCDSAADVWKHISMETEAKKSGISVRVDQLPEGFDRITICCADRPGLFADIAGTMALLGFDVRSARLFSGKYGMALDIFDVERPSRLEDEKSISPVIESELRRVFQDGEEFLYKKVTDKMRRKAGLGFLSGRGGLKKEIRVDNNASALFTVVEVYAPDRPGLLYELARTFFMNKVDVHLARINTEGRQASDVFYVQSLDGGKLDDSAVKEIKSSLKKLISS